jgi:hypothetical protein
MSVSFFVLQVTRQDLRNEEITAVCALGGALAVKIIFEFETASESTSIRNASAYLPAIVRRYIRELASPSQLGADASHQACAYGKSDGVSGKGHDGMSFPRQYVLCTRHKMTLTLHSIHFPHPEALLQRELFVSSRATLHMLRVFLNAAGDLDGLQDTQAQLAFRDDQVNFSLKMMRIA